ncbi:uncharacterized protein [Arachis hypogaea]|uniref:uncharacterized protein n=1 Tax=Arachis hypogaea TaxID=3818 RepID=UPI000DECFC58|nr:uncharacterized protein LOC112792351 isoform X1 [Arachis hypogaea]QHO03824.1 uncharacterized protein DS421_13g435450 [Arachis hypogaea]UWS13063.1 nodulin stress-upregulating 8 [Arachis hypogaea subsp. hypogaea]
MSTNKMCEMISLAILLLVLGSPCSAAFSWKTENKIKTAVHLSPKIEIGPGSVSNKNYYDIDFPRGHVALKGFTAEVVDEAGNSVPLHETYLHHWALIRYRQSKSKLATHASYDPHRVLHVSDSISESGVVRNSGICQGNVLGQYYGIGSETRGTNTDIPDPFGLEIGNPEEGYEEKWMLNIHAIDTRGVEDKLGCTECRCDLYNVTVNEFGKPLPPDYIGGLNCCYHETQCRLKKGFQAPKRSLYLRYTVKWMDWDEYVVPVKIYIIDVTDTLKISDTSSITSSDHDCRVEYEVDPCNTDTKKGNDCLDVKRTRLPFPKGGYVVYGVAHQHSAGIGATLYGQDGRVICTSMANYGTGDEAGNEAGYIVGMTTCYPKPGSVKIIDGEKLTLESNYSSSTRSHTGVMGLFYLLVAEQLPHQHYFTHSSSFFRNRNINNVFN